MGQTAVAAGEPTKRISLTLGQGTDTEVSVPLYHVILNEEIGAEDVDFLLGTEALAQLACCIDFRPPGATLLYHPLFPTTGRLDKVGQLPLDVTDRNMPRAPHATVMPWHSTGMEGRMWMGRPAGH
jgi:hypothetical protein